MMPAIAALAALLVAVPNPTLVDLQTGEARDLGSYTCLPPEGDTYPCQRVTDFSGMTFDPNGQRMLLFGGGHATTFRDDVDVFSMATLSWQRDYTPSTCAEMTYASFDETTASWTSTGHPHSRHTYDLLVYAPPLDEFLILRGGSGWGYCEGYSEVGGWFPAGQVPHYDCAQKTWSFGAALGGTWSSLGSAEWDPVSEQAIVVDANAVWRYDPVAREIVQLFSHGVADVGYSNNLVYFPPNDRFYFIGRGDVTHVWELTPNRSNLSLSSMAEVTALNPSAPATPESGWAYDATNELIVGGLIGGVLYGFDPVAGLWLERTLWVEGGGTAPLAFAAHTMDYDPDTNAFIFIDGDSFHTWAARFDTGGDVIAPAAPSAVSVE